MAQEIDNNLENLLYDVTDIIEQARYRVAVYVNSEASLMNWNVGKRIKARYYTKLPDKNCYLRNCKGR